jgi:hypothetical protein
MSSAGAIFHAAMQRISRSDGRSAVAAAAYRSGADLYDERTGQWAYYEHRTEHGQIGQTLLVLPSGEEPDRGKFWNDQAAHLKRGDANEAWELEVALPTALTDEQNAALIRRYAIELAGRYGVAADACIHTSLDNRPPPETSPLNGIFEPPEDKPLNPHCHIMLSACSVDMDGKLGRKCVALDPIHCKRNGLPTPAETERARWCELVNEALAAAGHDVRIDHRTLKEQGIERDPQRHAGKGAIGVWAEITAHNAQVKDDADELARLDAEYAAETKKLQAIMREIEQVNEPRKPFFPTTDREAGQVRDRFYALVDERIENHKADTVRVSEVEKRLSEIHEIHESQPHFWEYKKKKAKAAIDIEWNHLQKEHKELRHVIGTTCTRDEAQQAVLKEFPAYAPALEELNRRVQIIQWEGAVRRQEEDERRKIEIEVEKAAYFAELATQQTKAPEPPPKAPEREIEQSKAQETPSKSRDDDGLTM